jgi:phytoene dehydrogenase-like protein
MGAQRGPADPDLVIVGAGSAGIAAALFARAAGLDVLVLEAMARIGGRALTDTTRWGTPFDEGCSWLHRANDNPYTAYARAQGFELRPHESDLERVFLGPDPVPADRVSAAEDLVLQPKAAFEQVFEHVGAPFHEALPDDVRDSHVRRRSFPKIHPAIASACEALLARLDAIKPFRGA